MKLLVKGEEVECRVVGIHGWFVDHDGNYHEYHTPEEYEAIMEEAFGPDWNEGPLTV